MSKNEQDIERMGINVFPDLKKSNMTDFVVLDKKYVDQISQDMINLVGGKSNGINEEVLIDFEGMSNADEY